jgi:hypothetical protein
MGRSSGYLALRYSVVDFVLLAKRYLSILKWIKSDFAWMKERWEHLHEQILSCEGGQVLPLRRPLTLHKLVRWREGTMYP